MTLRSVPRRARPRAAAAAVVLGVTVGGLLGQPSHAAADRDLALSPAAAAITVPEADVLDVDFVDGTPTDHAQGIPARSVGAPVFGTDPGVPGTVATFDGDDAFAYPFVDQWSKLTSAFSVECVFRYNGTTPAVDGNICSNAEAGGVAFDVGGNTMEVWAHIGGAYKRINATLVGNRWYHAMAVWDGATLKLYVNGEVAAQAAATGALRLPPVHAQNWVVGADSAGQNGIQSYSLSSIKTNRVHSTALTADQVAVLSDQAFESVDSLVTLRSPKPGMTVGGGTVAVTGLLTQPAAVSYRLDGGAEVSLGDFEGEIAGQITDVTTGEHTLEVIAEATDGTTETEVVDFWVDASGPEITIASPVDGGAYVGESFAVDVTAEDPAGVDAVEILLDGEPVAVGDVIDPDAIEDGEHTLVVTATDQLLNTSTKAVTFTASGNAPDAPADPTPVDGEAEVTPRGAEISVTASDPAGDTLDVVFKWGHQAGGAVAVRQGSSTTAVPGRSAGDAAGDSSALDAADDNNLTTTAEGAYPFQQFEVEVPDDINAARFTVDWAGEVALGHRAALSVWSHATRSWQLLAEGQGGQPLDLSAEAVVDDTVRDGVAQLMVQDVPPAVIDEDDVTTLAWMTDTQWYSNKEPETYQKMVDWAVENRGPKDLGYGIHTGDIVQTPTASIEWARASEIMRTWDEADFPYGVVPGNHDDVGAGEYRPYREHFGAKRYDDNPWYGGTAHDNVQHYDLLSTPKADYLIMYLDWTLDDDEIEWANEVIGAHPDHNVILATHQYIGAGGAFSGPGERIFNEIVIPNQNVDLVLCGHIHNTAYNVKHLENGRVVVEVLYDTQELPTAGGGWMRTIDLDPVNGTMTQDSFSVLSDADSAFGDPEVENFTTELQIDTPTRSVSTDHLRVTALGSRRIGAANGVPSGERATVPTGELEPETTYQWYAQATDGDAYRATSPIWSFTTGAQPTAATTVTARDVTATYGQAATVSATLTPSSAIGTVSFTSGKISCEAPIADGRAQCSLGRLPAGTHQVTVEYPGDGDHAGSTGSTTVTVRKASPRLNAAAGQAAVPRRKPVLLKATVVAGATGKITFTANGGQKLCVAAVGGNGRASCKARANLRPGRYKVVASYPGSANYTSARDTFTFTKRR